MGLMGGTLAGTHGWDSWLELQVGLKGGTSGGTRSG